MLTATSRIGVVKVDRSKVVAASTDEVETATRRALRGRYVSEGTPRFDPSTKAVIEGTIQKLRRGTVEFDRAALSTLPDAYVMDT
jgi:hypothetical protein